MNIEKKAEGNYTEGIEKIDIEKITERILEKQESKKIEDEIDKRGLKVGQRALHNNGKEGRIGAISSPPYEKYDTPITFIFDRDPGEWRECTPWELEPIIPEEKK